MNTKTIIASIALVLLLAGGVYLFLESQPQAFRRDAALQGSLDGITQDYRRIIVLVDGSESLDPAAKARAIGAGRILFWRKHQALDELEAKLRQSQDGIQQLIRYLNDDRTLRTSWRFKTWWTGWRPIRRRRCADGAIWR